MGPRPDPAGATVGIVSFVGLTILGATVNPIFSQYAVLLALIAGVLELLPIIGPIIAAVPAILLAATAGLDAVGAAFILYLGVQQVENNLLVPKIQGDATNLHPSAVMLALIVGATIGGLLGAILALPVTAAGRGRSAYLFRRAGEAAGSRPAASPRRPPMGSRSRRWRPPAPSSRSRPARRARDDPPRR